jgi:hypothetical protein
MNHHIFRIFSALVFITFFAACSTNDKKKQVVDNVVADNQTIAVGEAFKVNIPNYFVEMWDVNPKADVQYGYISKEQDSASTDFEDEIYVTIMILPKSELVETFADSGRITLNKVNNRTVVNLELILDDFEAVNKTPKPLMINGVNAIRNEFKGRLGAYEVFYKMAIFETESDFYQLLTWCMEKHANKHKAEMDAMINSFESI